MAKRAEKSHFDKELYKKIGINNLIIFSIYSVAEKKEKCTLEKLVEECFFLFPEVFKFTHLQKWPDSRKLDRPLRDLRDKKIIIISGDPQKFFVLTKNGEKIAKEIKRIFSQRKLKI